MRQLIRYLWITGWYSLAIFVVLSAVSLSAARYLLPYLNTYNDEIELRISSLIGQPVKIGGLDAEWHGLGPKLVIKEVKLLNTENGDAIAKFDKAFLKFDLYSLIFRGQLGLSNLTVSGINLYIERDEEGRLSIGGMGIKDGKHTLDNEKLMQWILGQVKLEIEDANIYWHNRLLKTKPARFSNVNLTLKNNNDRHQLIGTVVLPHYLGENLTFAMDIFGNPLNAKLIRKGLVYIKGERLKLPSFTQTQLVENFNLDSLITDFEIWGTWEQGNLVKLVGDINASSISLSSETTSRIKKTVRLKNIAGKFRWQNIDNIWQLDINNFKFNRNGNPWPETKFTFKSSTLSPGTNSDIEMQLGFLRIEDLVYLTQLADLDESKRTALLSRNPAGTLEKTYLHYDGTTPNDPQFAFETNFDKLTLLPAGPVPGIRELSGSITANNTSGSINLDTTNAVAYVPNLFREPVPLDKLNGKLHWEKSDTSWQLSSDNLHIKNEDLDVRLKLDFDQPLNGASPFLNMIAKFKEGKGSSISRYIPFRLISKAAVDWVDKSILGGNIESGGAIFHGRLADFPFDNGEGKFSVIAHAHNFSIDFAPGWPALSKLMLDMNFLNRGVEINAQSGRILNSDLFDAIAQIDDLTAHPTIFKVSGNVKGETKEKLNFLRQTPKLKDNFAATLSEMSMRGESLLKLDVSLPLGKKALHMKPVINGSVELQDNSLRINGVLGEILTGLNGKLNFTGNSLSADALTGLFFNSPAKLEITTKHSENYSITQFKTESKIEPGVIVEHMIPSWSRYFRGTTQTTVKLDIPHKSNISSVKPVIRIQSHLENIGIDLPAPLHKKQDEKRLLDVTVMLTKNERTLNLQYGNLISSVIQYEVKNEKISLNRGKINVNGGKMISLPPSGISVTGKDIKQFSYDNWISVAENTPEFNTGKKSGPLTWLSSIKANIYELTAFGQTYHSVDVDALRNGNKWEANIQSKEISGDITLPIDMSSTPISMKLDKLILNSGSGKHEKSDPRKWPAVLINSERFVFDDIEFGSLLLSTSKRRNGLYIDYFEFSRPINKISGSGKWTFNGKKHSSSINFQSDSTNIGKTMTAMGYADTIKDGKGTLAMNLSWPDMPQNVSKNIINGSVNMNFSDGQLLDLSPGAGRIFGLLSLQALPRRLLLDFSDVFSKGFSFDKIQGDFSLDAGDAYTSNFELNGPAIRINISGRVGLADEDYDQLVTVIPDAASSIPLLTVLAGAQPIAAFVTWSLKNIFQSQIDKSLTIKYTITGSWENPEVIKITKPPSDTIDEEDEEP